MTSCQLSRVSFFYLLQNANLFKFSSKLNLNKLLFTAFAPLLPLLQYGIRMVQHRLAYARKASSRLFGAFYLCIQKLRVPHFHFSQKSVKSDFSRFFSSFIISLILVKIECCKNRNKYYIPQILFYFNLHFYGFSKIISIFAADMMRIVTLYH